MNITKAAIAGTLESSDCMVTVMPGDSGNVEYEIDSVVLNQYGNAILEVAQNTARKLGVQSAVIKIQDMGAFDCVIAARVETAVMRAVKGGAA